ncbi:MAG: hypothetical protein D6798_18315 [Deltaproteobacteria bacterium]|nr:MAG: hypothetical protein D6798_18315 [Deltaproteobacteria bacterium]
MAPVHPDLRRAGVALFHLGLVLAIAHVTVALEIGVTLSSQGSLVKSLVLLLYPVAVAMLGFGAALDRIVLRSDDPGPPLRASGAFLLLFLAVTLRLNFLSLDPTAQLVAAAAHFLVLGGWFLCAGVALARLVRVARMAGGHRTGALWATHQVGLVAGYLLQDLAVPVVGVNALHLVLALSLLLPTRLSLAALLGGCALAPMLDLDPGIDDLRDISVLQRVFAGHRVDEVSPAPVDAITADTITAGALPLRHRAWSRLGQFELFALDDGDSLSLRGW